MHEPCFTEGLTDSLIRRYLLQLASPAEQELVEISLFFYTDFGEYVDMIEDELIDDYVLDLLGPFERTRFESHFLISPERLRQLQFSQALQRYINSLRPQLT